MHSLKVMIMSIILIFATDVFPGGTAQDDTVKASRISIPPVIDGEMDDACWQEAKWQAIDQVWINYGEAVPAEDFTGHYKVVWSEEENLLYFVVEVIDDAFVDGYVYNRNPGEGGGYPNYDVVEVFIDENKSGGLHVFDGTGNIATQWGSNAENAFSYHITPVAPADGEVSMSMVACDIAGTDWGNYFIPDYADHLHEFALKRNGNQYVWEFSLIIYDESFDHNNQAASRVQLQAGKIMGLSLAYCDNDDPNEDPKKRDNFFGSVWVPESAFNDHWKEANGFGAIMLMGETTDVEQFSDDPAAPKATFQLYPNPSQGDIRLLLENDYSGQVNIEIYDIIGREVLRTAFQKKQINVRKLISARHLAAGVYFIKAEMAGQQQVQKLMILYH